MNAPYVRFKDVPEDMAHYEASVALDDVLGWFRDDGYSPRELADLCMEHVERVTEDE